MRRSLRWSTAILLLAVCAVYSRVEAFPNTLAFPPVAVTDPSYSAGPLQSLVVPVMSAAERARIRREHAQRQRQLRRAQRARRQKQQEQARRRQLQLQRQRAYRRQLQQQRQQAHQRQLQLQRQQARGRVGPPRRQVQPRPRSVPIQKSYPRSYSPKPRSTITDNARQRYLQQLQEARRRALPIQRLQLQRRTQPPVRRQAPRVVSPRRLQSPVHRQQQLQEAKRRALAIQQQLQRRGLPKTHRRTLPPTVNPRHLQTRPHKQLQLDLARRRLEALRRQQTGRRTTNVPTQRVPRATAVRRLPTHAPTTRVQKQRELKDLRRRLQTLRSKQVRPLSTRLPTRTVRTPSRKYAPIYGPSTKAKQRQQIEQARQRLQALRRQQEFRRAPRSTVGQPPRSARLPITPARRTHPRGVKKLSPADRRRTRHERQRLIERQRARRKHLEEQRQPPGKRKLASHGKEKSKPKSRPVSAPRASVKISEPKRKEPATPTQKQRLSLAQRELADAQEKLAKAHTKHAADVKRARQRYHDASKDVGKLAERWNKAVAAGDIDKATKLHAKLQAAKKRSDRYFEKQKKLRETRIDPEDAARIQKEISRARAKVARLERQRPIPRRTPVAKPTIAPISPGKSPTRITATTRAPSIVPQPEYKRISAGLPQVPKQTTGQQQKRLNTSTKKGTAEPQTGIAGPLHEASGVIIASGGPLLKSAGYGWLGHTETAISAAKEYQKGGWRGVVENTIVPQGIILGGQTAVGSLVVGGTALGPQMAAGAVGYGSYRLGQKYVAPLIAPYLGQKFYDWDQKFLDGKMFRSQ